MSIKIEGAQDVQVLEVKVIKKGEDVHSCCHCEREIGGRKVKIVAELIAPIPIIPTFDEPTSNKRKQFFFHPACWGGMNDRHPGATPGWILKAEARA
jgi:hypothetical protein